MNTYHVLGTVFKYLLSFHCSVGVFLPYISHILSIPLLQVPPALLKMKHGICHLYLLCSAVSWKTNIKWQLHSTLSLGFTLLFPFANLGKIQNSCEKSCWYKMLLPFSDLQTTCVVPIPWATKMQKEATALLPREKEEFLLCLACHHYHHQIVFAKPPGAQGSGVVKLASFPSPKSLQFK